MRLSIIIIALLIAVSLPAQSRYLDSLFAVEKTADILYGYNVIEVTI